MDALKADKNFDKLCECDNEKLGVEVQKAKKKLRTSFAYGPLSIFWAPTTEETFADNSAKTAAVARRHATSVALR